MSASSPTLWATASKEWVIPAKRKPGRKPKSDAPPLTNKDEELESKGRRVQNRAAQRAFRERKQSQLAELQAKVQSFEQGEVERNVAFQNIAKRLKEENEKLRKENTLLQARLNFFEQSQDSSKGNDLKRSRAASPNISSSFRSATSSRKKAKLTDETPQLLRVSPAYSPSQLPSPPSMISSPDSNESSDTHFSPISFDTPPPDSSVFPSDASMMANMLDFSQNVKSSNFENTHFPSFNCGFCDENTICVCREIALHQVVAERIGVPNHNVSKKTESFEKKSFGTFRNETTQASSSPPTSLSILDNLPGYQPPVPLRRRTTTTKTNSIFPITTGPPQHLDNKSPLTCSGDPSNCAACADDSFGKAFCAAIGESVANSPRCNDCPGGDIYGYSRNCASESSERSSASDTIPTNDAWLKLKSHPNVEFADLSLLADVVARRSKCTGPRVVISPSPESFIPERRLISNLYPQLSGATELDSQPIPDLHDFHAHRTDRPSGSPAPQLVPQEILMKCGRRRVREVHAGGVSDALRLLDAKFAQQ